MKMPEQYVRRTFPVQAVRITAENIYEVAEWCGGDVLDSGTPHIFLNAILPKPRKPRAFVGDWILKTNQGISTYNHKSFDRTFMPSH